MDNKRIQPLHELEPTPSKRTKMSSAYPPQSVPTHQYQQDFDYGSYPFMNWWNMSDHLLQHQMTMPSYFHPNLHLLYNNNPFMHKPYFQMDYSVRSYCPAPLGVVNNPIILD
jgi:hypothetical protein